MSHEELSPAVSIDRKDAIAEVRIDAPPVNALATQDWEAIAAAFTSISSDNAVRAAILHGERGRFCAGADINGLAHPPVGQDPATPFTVVADAAAAIRTCRVPVIAAIQGPAHGGGLELALACDIRIAGEKATFAAAGINMGLIASVRSLSQTFGDSVARRMLLTGERFDVHDARRLGLLIEGGSNPRKTARKMALQIAAKPPLAVEATKAALNELDRLDPTEHDAYVVETFRRLATSADHHEAIASFQEKRNGEFGRA